MQLKLLYLRRTRFAPISNTYKTTIFILIPYAIKSSY